MHKLAILDDYQNVALRYADWSALQQRCTVQVFDRNIADPDEAVKLLQPFDIICLMRERMPMPRALIERLPNLKLAVFTGLRTQSLDVEAASERGVIVCNTGGGGTDTTAELAWGLILALTRRIAFEHQGMRDGLWQRTVGTKLGGKTLGLLGLGKIGSQMARIARAFGMSVLAWSRSLSDEKANQAGAVCVEKDELFRRSDVISIHLVLGEESRGLVSAREIDLMKPTAYLINTSRGPIIEEAALLQALRTERIAGAGLDVFDREPLPADHPLRGLQNVVLTPHLGYVTDEVYRIFFQDALETVSAFLDGKPIHVLNPQALRRE
jgi:phosphoglycerate dehydrogenase-like enzyme